jgi:hypothetical protein
MFRLPERLPDLDTAQQHCGTDLANAWAHGNNVIIEPWREGGDGGDTLEPPVPPDLGQLEGPLSSASLRGPQDAPTGCAEAAERRDLLAYDAVRQAWTALARPSGTPAHPFRWAR